MIGIVAFHVALLVLALTIIRRVVPVKFVSNMLDYLHGAIGITKPPVEQAPKFALIWVVALTVIVDGCIAFLVFLTSRLP
jgi:hypothetical protein